jgi:hypothetical protein
MNRWEYWEQLGADLEAGRRVELLTLMGKLRYACPDKSDDELSRMIDQALSISDYIH